ncbi:galactosylceramide sulfotransferase-like [Ostrea edulis]|uniref:galactosylceramide sulfotransferase-like n=1 Tax=Ostrea edulis TaxID=37623 RepID=UPI0024AEA840|nr:galactosylceramide sulfotransferase-like [Ostrea edulis]
MKRMTVLLWRKRVKYLMFLVLFFSTFIYIFNVSFIVLGCSGSNENKNLRGIHGNMDEEQSCPEQNNFVFIKCMKCATETMGTIVRRFGLVRNLNFVVPVKNNIYLGWPFLIEDLDYRPSKRPFNILMEHAIYNHTRMAKMMANNTRYITIIRDPWHRLTSSFSYFSLGYVVEPPVNFSEYVQNIRKYDDIYKGPDKRAWRFCFPNGFSVVQNLMAHCLGMPLGFPAGRRDISLNDTAIMQYIHELDSQFFLVMNVDYFMESLILLKRMMCWTFKDILHHNSNVGKHKLHEIVPTEHEFQIYYNFSRIDFILYEHFNKSFWMKIQRHGPDFFDEVNHFKVVQLLMERFCFVENNANSKGQSIIIPKSKYNEEFTITSEDCGYMTRYLLQDIRDQYNKEELGGDKSMLWYAKEPDKGEIPKRGCSFPLP